LLKDSLSILLCLEEITEKLWNLRNEENIKAVFKAKHDISMFPHLKDNCQLTKTFSVV